MTVPPNARTAIVAALAAGIFVFSFLLRFNDPGGSFAGLTDDHFFYLVRGWQILFGDLPVAALPPLAVLVGGFETINALHVGVERIGRYLQVFYEGQPGGPAWESTAMAAAPRLRGGGVDPLFTVVFCAAAILNMTTALVPEPTALETLIVGGLHAAFLARVARARQMASTQRARELRAFQDTRAAAAAGTLDGEHAAR